MKNLLMALLCSAAATAVAQPILFDDFSYTSHKQMTRNGWIVRSVAGWPGIPGATWEPAGVTFVKDGKNRLMRMTASTDGTPAGTKQVQVCHARKYLNGTYAARVRFTDGGEDKTVQTFYTISPLVAPMDEQYSEMDFEYLPNGGWGRKGPTFFATTWETFHPEPTWKADNKHHAVSASYAGWHLLTIQVTDGIVRYFVDAKPFAEHGEKFYPEVPMSLNFNLWFIRDGLAPARDVRRYEQEVDWVFFTPHIRSAEEVEKQVAALRKKNVAFRDTVPGTKLESPCNL